LKTRHQQGRTDSLSGNIANRDTPSSIGQGDEVVVIAAKQTCGLHGRGELDARHDRGFGKNLALDLGG